MVSSNCLKAFVIKIIVELCLEKLTEKKRGNMIGCRKYLRAKVFSEEYKKSDDDLLPRARMRSKGF